MKTNTIIYLLITFFIATSCVEELELDFNYDVKNKLIVEGVITDVDTLQTIVLSLTAPYGSDSHCPPASGAMVSVYDGTSTYVFGETQPGVYQSNEFKGVPGNTYALTIFYDNEKYEAVSTMNEGFPIDSIGLRHFPFGYPANEPHGEVLIWGQESPTPNQFYVFQFGINGNWNDTLLQQGFYTDFMYNGAYFEGESIGFFSSLDDSVTIAVRSFSVEEEYFWFLDACIWNIMPNMFFSPPPANVKGNVSNGAFGYFRASSVHSHPPVTFSMKDLK
jgi:hypothetical protein